MAEKWRRWKAIISKQIRKMTLLLQRGNKRLSAWNTTTPLTTWNSRIHSHPNMTYKKKKKNLRAGLKVPQSLFTKPTKRAKAVTETSFHVRHLLAKHFGTDAEFYKEIMTVISDILLMDFKNKKGIKCQLTGCSWSSIGNEKSEGVIQGYFWSDSQGFAMLFHKW